MTINIENLSKRFNRELIFNNLSYSFSDHQKYVITGPNGSGKSTLLQILTGAVLPSNGMVNYVRSDKKIEPEDFYHHISFAAPYLELVEEFTLKEAIEFHFRFKQLKTGETIESLIRKTLFEGQQNKIIKNFSSGMKQRLKLGLAFYSETPILFLDEPTSNLDEEGVNWYLNQMDNQKDRLIVLASNIKNEYLNFDKELSISDYK